MKLSNVCGFLSLIVLIGCGGASNSKIEPITEASEGMVLAPGTYSVPCFENKTASQGFGSQVYSKATMILGSDGAGSNAFEIYSDIGCSTILANGTVQILHYETVSVNGEKILLMDQDDGSGVMRIWIPYKSQNSTLYFDLDFSDGESGPYLAEPTASEILEFMTGPEFQGILVQ